MATLDARRPLDTMPHPLFAGLLPVCLWLCLSQRQVARGLCLCVLDADGKRESREQKALGLAHHLTKSRAE